MRAQTLLIRTIALASALLLVLSACGSDPSAEVTTAAASSGSGADVPATGGEATEDAGDAGDAVSGGDAASGGTQGGGATPAPDVVDAEPDQSAPGSTDGQPMVGDTSNSENMSGDDDVDPPLDEPGPDPSGDDDPDGAVVSPPRPVDPGEPDITWARIEPMWDLLGPAVAYPDHVLLADDGRTVLVRFWNGVAPCSGARVTVTEGPDVVEVMLETGANPEAASMACIALAVANEIAVPLSADLGDRQLVVVEPAGFGGGDPGAPDDSGGSSVPGSPGDPGGDPFGDAVFSVDQYFGLSRTEAEALAEIEGRVLRIARIDDEYFALTEDFSPSRVNIEIEAGTVVDAWGG